MISPLLVFMTWTWWRCPYKWTQLISVLSELLDKHGPLKIHTCTVTLHLDRGSLDNRYHKEKQWLRGKLSECGKILASLFIKKSTDLCNKVNMMIVNSKKDHYKQEIEESLYSQNACLNVSTIFWTNINPRLCPNINPLRSCVSQRKRSLSMKA